MYDDFGRFFGSGTTNPCRVRVPADRGRGHSHLVVMIQVPADGVRPGIQALPGQFLAQPDDQLHGRLSDRRGRGPRPPGPRLERRLRHAVGAGNLTDRPLFDNNSSNDKPGFRYPGRLRPGRPA
jgi:hypothetical protein